MTGTQRYAALFIIIALGTGLLFHSLGRYRWYENFVDVGYETKNIGTESVNGTTTSADKVEKIDVNSAGVGELTLLPGIGRETALRIVEYREENGAYGSVEELINVHGIGPKKLEKIRKYVTIE
ncbi:MAG: helix-hairpin-helix domain-containing protein [Spirochaetes bacterium]|nr:helix-hairpin-helix domain-containing protein [Spirochaetota bacterium]